MWTRQNTLDCTLEMKRGDTLCHSRCDKLIWVVNLGFSSTLLLVAYAGCAVLSLSVRTKDASVCPV